MIRKIKQFTMHDKFKVFEILDSDLSLDAKIVYLTLYHLPSQLVPPFDEMKKYTSLPNTSRYKRALKELEIRGCLDMSGGQFVILDRLLPAPVEQILPTRGEVKPEVVNTDFNDFKAFFIAGFRENYKEPYPFQGGRDGMAIKQLISTYGLAGAKKKAETAWKFTSSRPSEEAFFRSVGRSIATLASQASKLIDTQIANRVISQEGKWDKHKITTLNGGAQS